MAEDGNRVKADLHLACSSGSFRCLCMWNMRSPPFTYSITKKSLDNRKKLAVKKQNNGGRVLRAQKESWITQSLTCFLSENRSAGQPGRDDWRPAQTHASLFGPNRCPGKETKHKSTHKCIRDHSDIVFSNLYLAE